MNYSKHQILACTGHCDNYVKALAAIAEDFVTEDSHAMVSPDKDNLGDGVGITVFYQQEDGSMDLFIQDGKPIRGDLSLCDVASWRSIC
jgi:hypothetical protein